MTDESTGSNRGVWQALAGYGIWGLFPLYWKALHAVPAVQLIGHRIVWSFVMVAGLLVVLGRAKAFGAGALRPKTVLVYFAAAVLLSANWLTYVWAVNAGFVVESSLGYFINPLLSVVFGVVFFAEKLRPVQWASVGLAAIGVAYLTVDYGRLPWIALVLAATFALYGVVKKRAPLGAIDGLALETGLLAAPALAVLVFAETSGEGHLIGGSPLMIALLVGTGVVTTVPLLLFSSAARRIPLTLIGVLQYITPTLQFLLGVFVFGEALTGHTLLGFATVWAALALFAGEAFVRKVASPVMAE